MAQSGQERLLSVINASDMVLREDGDSEDPVASRRVAEALASKASALRQLGRFEHAVSVWDELIGRHDSESSPGPSMVVMTALYWKARDLEQLGRHQESLAAVASLLGLSKCRAESDALALLVVRALTVKVRTLAALGSIDDAVNCAEEIVARACQADEPELREWAAWALEYESRLLIAEGRIDQALAASVRLEARLVDEPLESLVKVAEIINNHSMLLLQLGAANPAAVARFILLVMINTACQALGSVPARIARRLPDPIARYATCRGAQLANELDFVSLVRQARRRAEQARRASDAVTAKIGSSEDPELRRCAASAEYITGITLVVLGHPLAGIRAINTFTSRTDMDAIQAFQWLAARSEPNGTVLKQLGGISNAALRARMLGGNDPAITAIAYEDSLTDLQAHSARPLLSRLAARLLRPKVDKTSKDRR